MNIDVIEKDLEAALVLFDAGLPPDQIIYQYPSVREYFEAIAILESHLPRKALAESVLKHAPQRTRFVFPWVLVAPASILATLLIMITFSGVSQVGMRDTTIAMKTEDQGGNNTGVAVTESAGSVPTDSHGGSMTMMMKAAPTADVLTEEALNAEEASIDVTTEISQIFDEGSFDAALNQ